MGTAYLLEEGMGLVRPESLPLRERAAKVCREWGGTAGLLPGALGVAQDPAVAFGFL